MCFFTISVGAHVKQTLFSCVKVLCHTHLYTSLLCGLCSLIRPKLKSRADCYKKKTQILSWTMSKSGIYWGSRTISKSGLWNVSLRDSEIRKSKTEREESKQTWSDTTINRVLLAAKPGRVEIYSIKVLFTIHCFGERSESIILWL